MFHIFDARSLNSANAYRAGFSILQFAIAAKTSDHNTMSTLKITTTKNSMNFCMKKLLFGQSYITCTLCLIGVGFDIRIFSNADYAPALVIDGRRNIESCFGQLLLQLLNLPFQFCNLLLAFNI